MANKRVDYVIGFSADTTKLNSALKELQTQLSSLAQMSATSANLTTSVTAIRDAKQAALELNSILSKSINVNTGSLDISKFASQLKLSGQTLESFSSRLKQIGPEGSAAFLNLSHAITSAEAPLKRSNELMEKLWVTMKNTVRWQITSGLLTGFTTIISDAFRYAEDLNESLNNIRIVTGKSTEEMAQFAKQANKAAKELNTTTNKYAQGSLIYFQQGLGDKEVKERTDVTTKFANVSQESLTTSSEYLTAIWNNFAKGSKNLEYFADVVVALGAATASSSQEIATGLNKFAATAETVGLSYEYATAALATVTATTRQSADVVGTAFKTLFSRIQDLELGKTLDDGTTLGKYSQALDAVGVSIKDSNGDLQSMDNILSDIGEKWDTLSKDQQVALAQAVGGVRQYTQFIALMDNWDFMKENLETAKNATGELQNQADIFAESWEAARKNVKASAEGVYDSLINDEFWIDLTNGFADFLKGIEMVADSLGGLKGVLSIVAALVTKTFSTKIANNLRDMAYNVNVFRGTAAQDANALRADAAKRTTDILKGSSLASERGYGEILSQTADKQAMLNQRVAEMSEPQKAAISAQLELLRITKELALEQAKVAQESELEANANALATAQQLEVIGQKTTNQSGNKLWKSYSDNSADISYINSAIKYLNEVKNSGGKLSLTDSLKQSLRSRVPELANLTNDDDVYAYLLGLGWDESRPSGSRRHGGALANRQAQLSKDKAETNNRYKKNQRTKNAKYSVARDKVDRLAEESGQKAFRAALQGEEYAEQLNGFDKRLNLANTKDLYTDIANATSALSGLSMAWAGFQSLGQLFSSEDLSAGERLTALLSSMPTLIYGIQQAAAGLKETRVISNWTDSLSSTLSSGNQTNNFLANAIYAKKYAKELTALQAAGKGTAQQMEQMAAKMASTSAASLGALGTIALVVAGLAAVGLIIYEVAQGIETDAEKTEALNNQYNTLKSNYESVKSSVDSLASSLDSLGERQTNLAGLTEGTEEWKNAVQDVNSEVLELIRQYPELAKYVDKTNGVLSISEYGRTQVLNAKKAEQYAAERSMNLAAIAKNQQELSVLQKGAKVELADEFKTDRTSTYGTALNKQETLKLIDAIQQSGSWILSSKDELNKLGFTSDQQVRSIQENSDKVLELSNKMQANIEATSVLVSALLDESYDEEDVPAGVKDALSELYAKNPDVYQDKTTYDKQGLANAYKENIAGVEDARAAPWKNGIYVTYKNEDGTTREEFVSETAGTNILRAQNSQGKFAEKYGEVAKNLYDQYGEELATALIEYAGGNLDINDLDPDTYQQLIGLGKDAIQGVVNSLGQGAATGLDSQLEGYSEVKHNRIAYLGSDLGKALNSRDNILTNIAELKVKLADTEEGSEEYQELESQINELVDSLSENAKTIKLSINSSLRQDVDEAFDIGRDFDTLQEKIADGLEMTTDDVVALIDEGYGELLRNCEATTKGTISLNQSVVDAYVQQKKDEVEADRQAKITQLENQRALLVTQETALQEKQKLLEQAAEADSATAAAEYMARAMMAQATADDAAEQAAAITAGDTAKSEALTDNAKEVAQYVSDTLNATTNTALDDNLAIANSTQALATDVVAYWNQMAEARAQYYSINDKNTNYKPVTGVTAPQGNYGGVSDSTIEAFDLSKLTTKEDVEKQIGLWTTDILEKAANNADAIKAAAKSMLNDTKSELASVGAQIGSIDAALARLRSGNLIDSTVGGKSGSNTSKELKEVLERYHEITREIEYQKDLLDELSTRADRAYGTSKIEMLTQKIEKLNKVADLQSQKQAAAAAFVVSDLEALRAAGLSVEYDTASLELTNYTELLQQITDEYNSRINSASQEEQDLIQKEYDTKIKLLENYEDSIDTYREQLKAYEDAMRELEDTKLEKIKEALQVRIDWKEMRDTIRKLKKEIVSSTGDALTQGKATLVLSREDAEDEMSLYPDRKQKMDSLIESLKNANEYTDVAAIQKEIADLRTELVESGTSLLEYVNALKTALPDALDAAAEKFDEFISMLEHNADVLSSINELVDLQVINNSLAEKYALLGKSYNATMQNSLTQAKLQKKNMEEAQKQLQEAEIALAKAQEGTAEYEILKANRDSLLKNFQESESAMLEAAAQAMEAAKQLFSNELDAIFEEFEKKITNGLGYEWANTKFGYLEDEDDEWLDGVNRYIETQTLNNKLQQSIASASSDYAKGQLKALEEEFAIRQANEELSEYDIKIMEAKYNLTLKQIALEEAQNAKSKVRLVRGANGNYNYMFTADEDDIAKKQEESLKAQQDYYNTAKDEAKRASKEMLQIWEEWQEAVRKIMLDDSLTDEERQKQINETTEYYGRKYDAQTKKQQISLKDLQDAGKTTQEDAKKTANKLLDDQTKRGELSQENFKHIFESMTDTSGEFTDKYVDQMVELTDTTFSWTELTQNALSNIDTAFGNFKGNVSNIASELGLSFEELSGKVDLVNKANETLEEQGTQAIDAIWKKIGELREVTEEQAAWTTEIYKTVDALKELAETSADAVQKWNEAQQERKRLDATGSYNGGSEGAGSGGGSGGSNSSSGSNTNSTNSTSTAPEPRMRSQLGTFDSSSSVYKQLLGLGAIYEGGGWWNYPKSKKNAIDDAIFGRVRNSSGGGNSTTTNRVSRFDTGGYTGVWGSDGRVAVLHQKELVLNQEDTRNMLAAVQSVRDLAPEVIAEMRARISGASNASQQLFGSRFSGIRADFARNAAELMQNVNINADFPGVRDAIEIKEALESLVQTSSQRMNFYTK